MIVRVLRADADKMREYERVAAELLEGMHTTELKQKEETVTEEWAHACVSVLLREVLGAAGGEPRHVCGICGALVLLSVILLSYGGE